MDQLLIDIWNSRLKRLLEDVLKLESAEKAALSTAIIEMQDNLIRITPEHFNDVIDNLASQYDSIKVLIKHDESMENEFDDAELDEETGEFVDEGFDDFGEDQGGMEIGFDDERESDDFGDESAGGFAGL